MKVKQENGQSFSGVPSVPDRSGTLRRFFLAGLLGAGLMAGVPEPYAQAGTEGLTALDREASSGNRASMVTLGLRYDYGQKGAPRDLARAIFWYKKAAGLGYAPAEMILSQRYEVGRGVPQDDRLAVRWLRISAHHGYPPAEDALGDRYASGQGVPKDGKRALHWYFLAAAHGYGESQDLLGEAYEMGRGVPKNLGKAADWYRRAAKDAGNPDAFFRLGRFAEKGLGGLRKDPSEAMFWYSLAKETSLSARAAWQRLAKVLPEKDKTRAWKLATEFRARYSSRWNRWVLRP